MMVIVSPKATPKQNKPKQQNKTDRKWIACQDQAILARAKSHTDV